MTVEICPTCRKTLSIECFRPEMSDEEKSDYLVVDHLRTETVREIVFRQSTPISFQRRIADSFKEHGFRAELFPGHPVVRVRPSLIVEANKE